MYYDIIMNFKTRLALNSKLLSDDYLGTRILYLLRKSQFIELDDLVLLYISIFTRSNEIYSNDFPKILKLDYFKRKDGTVINHTNIHLDMVSRYYFNFQFLKSLNVFVSYPYISRNFGLAVPWSYISIPYHYDYDIYIQRRIIPIRFNTDFPFMSGPGNQGKSSIYRFYEKKQPIIDYSSLYPSLYPKSMYLDSDIDGNELFTLQETRKKEKSNKRKNKRKNKKRVKSNRNKMGGR